MPTTVEGCEAEAEVLTDPEKQQVWLLFDQTLEASEGQTRRARARHGKLQLNLVRKVSTNCKRYKQLQWQFYGDVDIDKDGM